MPSASLVPAIPVAVADSESLARSVHQSSGYRKGRDGEEVKVRFRAFEPPRDPTDQIRFFPTFPSTVPSM